MSTSNEGPGSPEWYARAEPLLRRLRRTEHVQAAIDHIKALSDQEWSPETEAEIRRAALTILDDYIRARVGRSGSIPAAEFELIRRLEVALGITPVIVLTHPVPSGQKPQPEDYRLADSLYTWLERDIEEAQRLQKEASETQVVLDPEKPGGGSQPRGGPGRRPTLLAEHVKYLLRERYPKWDGESEFPGPNNQELRNWLCERLRGNAWVDWPPRWSSALSWGDALGSYPYKPADIDPKNRGRLWSIINGLKNPQRH